MKKIYSTLRLLLACSTLAIAPAMAEVITFNQQAPEVFDGGAVLHEAGFDLAVLDGPVVASLGLHGTAGAILDPVDPYSCELVSCPVGDGSQYYAGLGDGSVHLSHAGGLGFKLDGLDFGFVATLPLPNAVYGQLVLTGTRLGGGTVNLSLDFPGQDSDGNFVFGSAALGAFSGVQLSSLDIGACVFTDSGSCVNSLDDMAYGQAQFALDNISVSAVPEPSAWLLLLAGLVGMALLARRRKAGGWGVVVLLLGLTGAVQAAPTSSIVTLTGDTTGGPTFLRPLQDGTPAIGDYSGYTAYRLFDLDIKQDAPVVMIQATCSFDCSVFFYLGTFDASAPLQNFIAGDDNFVSPQTAAIAGSLPAGHYSFLVTGDSYRDYGFFSATFASVVPFTITAVPEPSSWLMLAVGLAGVGLALRRRGRRVLAMALLAGVVQQAGAEVITVTGDTTFGPTFHRPANWGGEPAAIGLDVAYRTYEISVDTSDYNVSFLTLCTYNCGSFVYHDSFDPAHAGNNIEAGRAKGGRDDFGESSFSISMEPGRKYILVVTGYADYDWGFYSTTIGSIGGITITAVPEPSVYVMLLAGLVGVALAARRRAEEGPARV